MDDEKLAKMEEVIQAIIYTKCIHNECAKCKYEPFTECKQLCIIENIINLPPEEIEKLISETYWAKRLED